MSAAKDGRELRSVGTAACSAEDWETALRVDSRYGSRATRQNLYLVAAAAVVLLFTPEIFMNPTEPLSWIMLALAVGFGVFVWKYPAHHNKTYAQSRAAQTPEVRLSTSLTEALLQDSFGEERFPFEGALRVVEYQGRLVFLGGGGRLHVFPLSALDEAEAEQVRGLLRRQLGERYQKTETLPAAGLFSQRKTQIGR